MGYSGRVLASRFYGTVEFDARRNFVVEGRSPRVCREFAGSTSARIFVNIRKGKATDTHICNKQRCFWQWLKTVVTSSAFNSCHDNLCKTLVSGFGEVGLIRPAENTLGDASSWSGRRRSFEGSKINTHDLILRIVRSSHEKGTISARPRTIKAGPVETCRMVQLGSLAQIARIVVVIHIIIINGRVHVPKFRIAAY